MCSPNDIERLLKSPLRHLKSPACNTADVVNAARYAREAGIAFRARSGLPSLEGWSAIDGF
jgi:hypothetical protein